MRLPSRYPTLSSSLRVHVEPTTTQNDGLHPSLEGRGRRCCWQGTWATGLCLFVFEGDGGSIWKDHEQDYILRLIHTLPALKLPIY